MTQAATPLEGSCAEYFAIPVAMLLRDMRGAFSLFIKQGKEYVLYTRAGEVFCERHQQVLAVSGVQSLYVQEQERPEYREHVVSSLGTVLNDETIALGVRAQVFYNATSEVVEEVFANKLPPVVCRKQFDRVFEFVAHGVSFLTLEHSIKTIASLITHDYHTFSHSVHVFIYSQVLLQSYGFDDKSLIQFGLGAMLHDVGKTYIADSILNKPGSLTKEERERINDHPVLGAGSCTLVPLSQDALNCILFHHEKMDGSGYPCGLQGEEIPLPVRAVTIADIYDAICSNRPYAKALNPFQVLRIMKDEMSHGLDMEMFTRFVRMLSGAGSV